VGGSQHSGLLLVGRPRMHARWAPSWAGLLHVTRALWQARQQPTFAAPVTTHYAARLLPASRHPTQAPIHRLAAFRRPTPPMHGGSVR
jgi:hypothetical protein